MEGTDGIWRVQTTYGGYIRCMEGTDDVWRAQMTCGGHRWCRRRVKGRDDVWRAQTTCRGHRQCLEGTDDIWRAQMMYRGYRWRVEGTDDVWRVPTTCGEHRRCRWHVKGTDEVRWCVNGTDNVWMAQTTCRRHRQRMEGTDDVGMEQGWAMSIEANLWRTVSKTKQETMSDNLLLGPKRRLSSFGPFTCVHLWLWGCELGVVVGAEQVVMQRCWC